MPGMGTLASVSFAVGVGFYLVAHGQIRAARRRRSWPRVPGTITHAEVLTHGSSGSFRTGVVRYAYALEPMTAYRGGDRQYEGRLESETSESPEAAEALLAKYRVGERVEVLYDPSRPSRSILDGAPRPPGYAKPLAMAALAMALFSAVVLALASSGD